ncbi:zinc finger and BTB domain-containing protein 9-like [Branchiostoma lanceolatum]|uniref:zinc finger and BTB domain-containing protein 9-like n=1 Tax=Branchiostoma lanceolatum TaxID=7740 RepID=UPI00345299A7
MASGSRIIDIPFQEQERRLLSQLNTMREQGQLCDMTVRVGTREFRCHQAVLAASSGHFHSVFVQGALSFPKMLDLAFTSADIFSIVLDYIYTASLKCPTDVLPQVLQAAKVLEIHTLVDHLLLFSASQEGGRDGETAPSSCTDLPVPSGVNTPVSSPGPGVRDNVMVKQEQEFNQEEVRPQSEDSRLEENPGSMGSQIAELRAEVAFLRQQLQAVIGQEAIVEHSSLPLVQHPGSGDGESELMPCSGVYLHPSDLRVLVGRANYSGRQLCHNLFDHFHRNMDLTIYTAFVKNGRTGKNGEHGRVLDQNVLQAIEGFVLKKMTKERWKADVSRSQIHRIFGNKCTAAVRGTKRKLTSPTADAIHTHFPTGAQPGSYNEMRPTSQ